MPRLLHHISVRYLVRPLPRKGDRFIPQPQINPSRYSIMSRTEGRSSLSAASGSVSRRRLM